MRWRDFSLFEKILVVVLGLWFTIGWLVAIKFPNPSLFMAVPVLVIISVLAVLWLLAKAFTFTAWVLRRLGH